MNMLGRRTLNVEPSGIVFLTSVGIGIGFLLNCRFSVDLRIGFKIEKSCWFLVGFLKGLYFALTDMLPYSFC
jgi:hypothetical protein